MAPSTASYTHQTLARRLLFPHVPPNVALPPLFLSAACPPELGEEVYDLIALALRAFVNSWWTRLTRYDKEFLPQITAIITHVIRVLERRLVDADLPVLVFSDIPALVTQHYADYRQAASKASTSYATGGALVLPQLFHQLQPHMAVSSDGSVDEEYFRQVFDHILRECLPAEDYAPEAERFIVREIILKVVVKDVIPLITQPWFIQKLALDVLGVPSEQPSLPSVDSRFSKSSVVVLLLSAIQTISGTCIMLIHAYKRVVYMLPMINQSAWSSRLMDGPAHATRSVSTTPSTSSVSSIASTPVPENTLAAGPLDLTRGPLEMISKVLCVHDRLAAAALVQCVALVCRSCQTFMNKLLCYLLYTHVLSASSILPVVRTSKQTLFPNGYPGPPPADPSPEEQVVIREKLVKRMAELIPPIARSVVLGPGTDTVEMVVDGLSDGACNRHLAVFLLDAIVLSVFPEMGVLP